MICLAVNAVKAVNFGDNLVQTPRPGVQYPGREFVEKNERIAVNSGEKISAFTAFTHSSQILHF